MSSLPPVDSSGLVPSGGVALDTSMPTAAAAAAAAALPHTHTLKHSTIQTADPSQTQYAQHEHDAKTNGDALAPAALESSVSVASYHHPDESENKRQRVDPYPHASSSLAAAAAVPFPAFTIPIPPASPASVGVGANGQLQPSADHQSDGIPYQPAPATATTADVSDASKRRSRPPAQAVPPRPVGASLSLGDIPLLNKRLEKVSNEDSRTKLLFLVCFPTYVGAIPERAAKKTLRLFAGYPTDDQREAARQKLNEFAADLDLLRKTCRLLDLGVDGADAPILIDAIIAYLSAPTIIVHPPKEDSLTQSGSGLDGTLPPPHAKRPRKPKELRNKRPPNPYLLFACDHREQVTAASPGLQMMEVNRLLGQLWARADEPTKAKYTKLCDEARVIWDRDHPDQARPPGGSGRKRKRPGAGEDSLQDEFGGAHSDQDSEMSDPLRQPSSTPVPPLSGSSYAASPAPTPIVDRELALQLATAIAKILTNADLNKVTLRQVKAQLAQSFSEKVVTQNQRLISDLVDRELMAMP